MRLKSDTKRVMPLLAILLIATACGSAATAQPITPTTPVSAVSPTVTAAPAPTATLTAPDTPSAPTSLPPDATPVATTIPAATAAPTSTPAPLPTATPEPADTPGPTATAKPVPTPTPVAATQEPPLVPPTPTAKPAPTPAPEDLMSDIVNFTLENLNVPVGTKVTWTNQDGVPHTSTSGVPDGQSDVWDSPVFSPGSSFSFTFTEAGTYSYFCRIHLTAMQAAISVGQNGTPLPSTLQGGGSYDY